ncbi:MAG: GNAT family N-acetyltransferase [Deltaproteobacteria bacterium]|nr:GNAT family N-acetyltransferase [Deltaproteobacteria bacterium]
MTARPLTKADYDRIVRVIDDWWGGPTGTLAHPIFFYELGELGRVVETGGRLVGFLFGFVAPGRPGPVGYVHLVGIHPEYRRRGVGSMLYASFEKACATAGCRSLKAITTTANEGSVHFHAALGWTAQRIEDYAGPGRARLVFSKALGDPRAEGAAEH